MAGARAAIVCGGGSRPNPGKVSKMATRFDHVVLGCLDLEAGVADLSARIGAPPAGRGRHEAMSTHNALWAMGDAYLELIAIDPEAPDPGRPRWFGLDEPSVHERMAAGPRLLTWMAATNDPAAVARAAPAPFGPIETFSRDDLRWRLSVPLAGAPALDGVFPGPISWLQGAHPSRRLGDQGLHCAAFTLSHPEIEAVTAAYGALPRPIHLKPGPANLVLDLVTPKGLVSFRAFD